MAISGCGHFAIPVDSAVHNNKTGVVVTSAMLKGQFLLFDTEGAQIAFENKEPALIPWRTPVLIEMEPGSYNFDMWHKYLGLKNGTTSNCINIEKDEIILINYKTAQTMAGESILEISDIGNANKSVSCKIAE